MQIFLGFNFRRFLFCDLNSAQLNLIGFLAATCVATYKTSYQF
ncbi:hypothetical protein CAMRE0001_1125 [Campylobacter rectus RM3267]|uniref:Uncharacterized protein n=1 Tax=Campylobacter rectus RM3267 TaxID=553218 RepID=B9D0C5_CAMRE|nr:hypothetical protein CAMRE0001_1125 [Campylobacter rectus RM3267]